MTFGAGTGLIVFNHTASSYVFAPTITGAVTGTVEVDAGTTILTANNTYLGATNINGGALIVNGSIGSSALTTVNGGLLGGVGTVGNTQINAGGTFAPGPQTAPGPMTVAGTLAFQPGAFYLVQVNPTTASIANMTGTASLAGTVLANFAPGAATSPGNTRSCMQMVALVEQRSLASRATRISTPVSATTRTTFT